MVTNGVTAGHEDFSAALKAIADGRGTLILGGVVRALGMFCLAVGLIYLFEAAVARAPKIKRWMGVVVLFGPLLLGVNSIYSSVALSDAANGYIAAEPELTTEAPAIDSYLAELEEHPNIASRSIVYTEENAVDVLGSDGKVFTLQPADAAEREEIVEALTKADAEPEEVASGDPGDLAGIHFISESTAISTERQIAMVGVLCLIVGVVYAALWAMRVGLLTRFMGTLGLALGAATIILGPIWSPLGLALWMGAVGLIYVDRWPGGRPPAWGAGEAIPWPVRGQEATAEPTPAGAADVDSDVIDEPSGSASPSGPAPRKRKRRSR